MIGKSIGIVLFAVFTIVVIGLILSLPVMLLWNHALVPAVSGLHEIGWLQAWGILILFGILFKTTNEVKSN